MTEIKIKQSRPVGSGIVIAILMLTAFALFKVGPKLAGIQADHEARQREQEAVQHNRQTLKVLNEEFSKPGNAAERFLETLPQRASRSKANETPAPNETPTSPAPAAATRATTFFGQLAKQMEEFSRQNNVTVAAELLRRGLTDDGRGKTSQQADEMTAHGTAFDDKGFQHTYKVTFRLQGAGPDQKFELLRVEIDGQASEAAAPAP